MGNTQQEEAVAINNHARLHQYQTASSVAALTPVKRTENSRIVTVIVVEEQIQFEIDVTDPNNERTCGWLLSEVTRKYTIILEAMQREQLQQQIKPFPNYKDVRLPRQKRRYIVALKTKDFREGIDSWLNQYERDLSVLKDGTVLIAHFAKLKINGAQNSLPLSLAQRGEISIEDFEQMRVIGRGGFSRVILARKKDTGRLYAIKILRKDRLISENQIKPILSERRVLEQLDHPFVIKLHWAFQSERELYFVMDICTGGELFFHLLQQRRFSERLAKFYMCEILLGFRYMHERDIVYRDIKPENILVDMDGHIRVADFGLAKIIGRNERSYSFCGSPEYLSPEMLQSGEGHDRRLDIYCLGVLLYEMLTGLPPFFDDDHQQMFEKILYAELALDQPFLSREVKDLLAGMLEKDPGKRFQSIDEIMGHGWFAEIDWRQVMSKSMRPPLLPDINSCYFEQDNGEEEVEVAANEDESQSAFCLLNRSMQQRQRQSYYIHSTVQLQSSADCENGGTGGRSGQPSFFRSPSQLRQLFDSSGLFTNMNNESVIFPTMTMQKQESVRQDPDFEGSKPFAEFDYANPPLAEIQILRVLENHIQRKKRAHLDKARKFKEQLLQRRQQVVYREDIKKVSQLNPQDVGEGIVESDIVGAVDDESADVSASPQQRNLLQGSRKQKSPPFLSTIGSSELPSSELAHQQIFSDSEIYHHQDAESMRSFGRKRSSQGLHVVAEELDRGERQLAERIGNYDYDKLPPQNRNHHHHLAAAAGADPEMSSSLGNETAGFSARGSKKPTMPKPPPSLPVEHAEERKYPQAAATASVHQMPLASSETISIQKIASTSSSKKPPSRFDGVLDERKKGSPALSNKLEYAQMLSKSQVIGFDCEPQSPATELIHRRNGGEVMTEERSEDVTVENFQHGQTLGSLESKLSIRGGGQPPISPRKQLHQPAQQLALPVASTAATAKKNHSTTKCLKKQATHQQSSQSSQQVRIGGQTAFTGFPKAPPARRDTSPKKQMKKGSNHQVLQKMLVGEPRPANPRQGSVDDGDGDDEDDDDDDAENHLVADENEETSEVAVAQLRQVSPQRNVVRKSTGALAAGVSQNPAKAQLFGNSEEHPKSTLMSARIAVDGPQPHAQPVSLKQLLMGGSAAGSLGHTGSKSPDPSIKRGGLLPVAPSTEMRSSCLLSLHHQHQLPKSKTKQQQSLLSISPLKVAPPTLSTTGFKAPASSHGGRMSGSPFNLSPRRVKGAKQPQLGGPKQPLCHHHNQQQRQSTSNLLSMPTATTKHSRDTLALKKRRGKSTEKLVSHPQQQHRQLLLKTASSRSLHQLQVAPPSSNRKSGARQPPTPHLKPEKRQQQWPLKKMKQDHHHHQQLLDSSRNVGHQLMRPGGTASSKNRPSQIAAAMTCTTQSKKQGQQLPSQRQSASPPPITSSLQKQRSRKQQLKIQLVSMSNCCDEEQRQQDQMIGYTHDFLELPPANSTSTKPFNTIATDSKKKSKMIEQKNPMATQLLMKQQTGNKKAQKALANKKQQQQQQQANCNNKSPIRIGKLSSLHQVPPADEQQQESEAQPDGGVIMVHRHHENDNQQAEKVQQRRKIVVTTSQTSSLNVDDEEVSSDDDYLNSQTNSVSAPTASNQQLVTAAAAGGASGQHQEAIYNCLFDASKETSYKPIPYSTKSQSKHLHNQQSKAN